MIISHNTSGFLSKQHLLKLVTILFMLTFSSHSLGWTITHFAMRDRSGVPVNHHEWDVNPQGATIRDLHICLKSIADNKVDSNKDGSVSAAENRAFEADMLDDWETPDIHSGANPITNWHFSVTRNRSNGKVCLNFYGSTPLPANAKTSFNLKLKFNSNHFEKGNTAAWVTDTKADAIATNNGNQTPNSPIPNGNKPNVGGPIVLAAQQPNSRNLLWWGVLSVVVLIAIIVIMLSKKRGKNSPSESDPPDDSH